MAARLDELNTERRDIETQVRDLALQQAEDRGYDAPLVWAAGEGWHPGVVGIVASRMKDATNRPSIVIGLEGDEGKGSGRSVSGIDLGAVIQKVAAEGLLIKGGGHKMAAGLTVARDKLKPAMARIGELLAKQGADQIGPSDLKLDGVQIHFAKQVGANHLKVTFGDGLSARLDAISFGAMDGPMGHMLMNHNGARFHLAGRLDINTWQGRRSPQLRLEDASPAS